MSRQIDLSSRFHTKGGYASYHIENIEFIPSFIMFFLKIFGLYKQGLNNVLNYRIERNQVFLKNLPPHFNGFQILQLADMHIDTIPDKGQKLLNILKGIEPDIVVFTGDFCFPDIHVPNSALKLIDTIINVLDSPYGVFGTLGNHDFIEFVPKLEKSGIKILLNEAMPIKKDDAEIWISGIDDAHKYNCHDIQKALSNIPEKAIAIFLSHTPETYAEAADAGIDYFLCGHTHGGQLCLPGSIPIVTNAKCPRKFCSGPWKYKKMQGYTSSGIGFSCLPVRYNCPPEITLHELTCISHE